MKKKKKTIDFTRISYKSVSKREREREKGCTFYLHSAVKKKVTTSLYLYYSVIFCFFTVAFYLVHSKPNDLEF